MPVDGSDDRVVDAISSVDYPDAYGAQDDGGDEAPTQDAVHRADHLGVFDFSHVSTLPTPAW